MFLKKKRRVRKSEITDEAIAATLGILKIAAREMAEFEIENKGQQRVRDYLVKETEKAAELLHKEWIESD